jgi:hypothetical protein
MISLAIARFVTCTWYRLAMMAITMNITTMGSTSMSITMNPTIMGANRMSTSIIAIRIVAESITVPCAVKVIKCTINPVIARFAGCT